MLSKVFSVALVGLKSELIEVEVKTTYGLRYFEIIGLPDKSVEEAKERVNSAIENSGFASPMHQAVRTLISLAPADIKKEGSFYDLSIAVGYLLAERKIKFDPRHKIFLGELGLDGKLKRIKGALIAAFFAQEKNFKEIILPKENLYEASLVLLAEGVKEKIKIIGCESLLEVINYLENKKQIEMPKIDLEALLKQEDFSFDLGYIKGQEFSKRALEVAAAGGHNFLMKGPPGTGKTLLAKGLATVLPKLSFAEALEVTKIYSISGLLPPQKPLIVYPPFRSPHHSCSEVALIGGGNPPRPGEISLAHRGVLFLDEFPEFHRDVLESLRQPIEEGVITIARAHYSLTFPARFILVIASNPCPCGYYGDPERRCVCNPSQLQMYQRKLSGPLMDRIDLFVYVGQIKYEKLKTLDKVNESAEIRKRIEAARFIQKERFKKEKIFINAEMGIPEIKKYCHLNIDSEDLLKKYIDSAKLSIRGYHRVLRVARTIADLANSSQILTEHLGEALMYRTQEN